MDKKNRLLFLDFLRILAAFSVVMLHVASRYIMYNEVNGANFMVANFYNSINRFGVPIFIMISGVLFLGSSKEINIKRLWFHNIFRLFATFIIWNYIYYAYHSIYEWHFDFIHQGVVRTATGIMYATSHLWFIGMLIGLYALTPVIKSWTDNAKKENVEYFLFIFFVFQILVTTVKLLLRSSLVDYTAEVFEITELTAYLGYYVLGYYLYKYELPKKLKLIIYCSIPVDIAVNYLSSYFISKKTDMYDPGIYDSFGICTFIEVIALFLIVKGLCDRFKINELSEKIIRNIAADTFGIYLMHIMLLDFLISKGLLDRFAVNLYWQIPISLFIFVVCMLVAAILRRIPFIGRYLG